MGNKTLKEFLKKHDACKDGYLFAKDLTLEEFLNTCKRGDWILWLFARMNPSDIKELTLVKGHCANTVRHLMKDGISLKAVDVAIAFGEGRATRQELEETYATTHVAYTAYAADVYTAWAAGAAACAAAVVTDAADAFYAVDAYEASYNAAYAADAAFYAADAAGAAKKENLKQTADICRKYLPIEIWDQSKL